MEKKSILVKRIHPNPDNPRLEAGDVTELANSIRSHGLEQPLLVIPASWLGPADEEHFLLEDGYRRWVACKKVFESVECLVRIPHPEDDLPRRAVTIGLITSVHGQELNPIEKARAMGRLRDEYHLNQVQIAHEIGIGPTAVSRYMMLLELADDAQERVRTGRLGVDTAIGLVKRHRMMARRKAGHKPANVGWEPDHFTTKHPLARRAGRICDARNHNSRRRLGDIACGQCWEEAIRQDQTTVLNAAYQDAQKGSPPFLAPPFATADGGARSGIVGNGV